ncbi:PH domain-containing protein [Peribacillus simplex]|uniref:PH domain-containing protein n=2 Tax=Peribacillus TaxID=2675229 RepID=A0AA90P104_9BACI|nr:MULTISPECIES: PH domain-containing protein [Peribacillus]MDP1418211.1 PH domain-containing protein [Peribacillus simplex]MDP1451087.1 PH domain-containing protein [Peribacillus frigoritolerans]
MTKAKRYNPLLMLFNFCKLIRNSIFFVIYFFVIKAGSESTFITYGRIVFFIAFGLTLISIILKWFTHKFELDNRSFHLYKGIFSKSERTIPFSEIQNVNRHTSLFHRIFKVTSVNFETGIAGGDADVRFEVISQKEADRMESHMKSTVQEELATIHASEYKDIASVEAEVKKGISNRTNHYKPTKKDIIKASFTSLSFLVLIPLISSFYFKINEIFHVENEAVGIFEKLIGSWWMVTFIIIVLVIASITFGIVRTFLKYGNYQVSSDHDRIYITKGLIDETAFSISKEKVQAIEIKQSIMKRILGLAEVKLTSAGGLSSEEDTLEINSLYPYLPVKRAYEMVSEILPFYEITQKMTPLPIKSFWVRILWPSWLWIIATVFLLYFKPTVLEVEETWWMLSAILLIIIFVSRLLDFFNTFYILNDHFIQFKKGSMATSLFVSKRDKIIEVNVTRNIIQKMLGLASIGTINRAKPVHHAGINHVSIEMADAFYKWYMERRNEIKVE